MVSITLAFTSRVDFRLFGVAGAGMALWQYLTKHYMLRWSKETMYVLVWDTIIGKGPYWNGSTNPSTGATLTLHSIYTSHTLTQVTPTTVLVSTHSPQTALQLYSPKPRLHHFYKKEPLPQSTRLQRICINISSSYNRIRYLFNKFHKRKLFQTFWS